MDPNFGLTAIGKPEALLADLIASYKPTWINVAAVSAVKAK